MPAPETRYAKSGDVNVAYQVLGKGPIDLVYVWGWISHLDFQWTNPTIESFLRRLTSFSRLIMFDRRGTGLSDPVGATPTFEERMDDIRAVMDAVGSERAALLGFSEGAALSVLFAATYPGRTTALIIYDGIAVGGLVEDGRPDPEWTESAMRIHETIDRWGEGETMWWVAPSRLAAWRACPARSISEAAEINRPLVRSRSARISASCAERSSVSATIRNASANLLPSVQACNVT
jgi:pimeloyl-ACP methyl ester carboxylesterase